MWLMTRVLASVLFPTSHVWKKPGDSHTENYSRDNLGRMCSVLKYFQCVPICWDITLTSGQGRVSSSLPTILCSQEHRPHVQPVHSWVAVSGFSAVWWLLHLSPADYSKCHPWVQDLSCRLAVCPLFPTLLQPLSLGLSFPTGPGSFWKGQLCWPLDVQCRKSLLVVWILQTKMSTRKNRSLQCCLLCVLTAMSCSLGRLRVSLRCLARQREGDKRKEDERRYLKTFSVAHRCTCPQTKSTKHQKYIKEQGTSVHSREAESCVS